jgi:hypothetical protein
LIFNNFNFILDFFKTEGVISGIGLTEINDRVFIIDGSNKIFIDDFDNKMNDIFINRRIFLFFNKLLENR